MFGGNGKAMGGIHGARRARGPHAEEGRGAEVLQALHHLGHCLVGQHVWWPGRPAAPGRERGEGGVANEQQTVSP